MHFKAMSGRLKCARQSVRHAHRQEAEPARHDECSVGRARDASMTICMATHLQQVGGGFEQADACAWHYARRAAPAVVAAAAVL